jgi:hypothetical protein
MSRQLPFLALDSNNKRTILNDYSLPMSGGNVTNKKETKMAHIMTNQEVQSHTKKLVARLLGQDAALDDETAARIKEFLSDKLSDKDHTKLCAMLNGCVEAEDDNDKDKLPRAGVSAADAASFNARFPGLSHVRLDNSGIQPKPRAGYSDAAAASFAARFPGLAKIRQA